MVNYSIVMRSNPMDADAAKKAYASAQYSEEGLYELRIEYQSNIYRIFFCFDEGRIVILFNGFQKKTEKTPKKEIDKAKILRKEYYGSKNK